MHISRVKFMKIECLFLLQQVLGLILKGDSGRLYELIE